MPELQKAVYSIYSDCFKLKRSETLLILCDHSRLELGKQFYSVAQNMGFPAHLSILPCSALTQPSTLPILAPYLNRMDAAVFLTETSISHTPLRRQASKKGTRIASMPGITREILIRNMNGNYGRTKALSRKIADILTIAKEGHILTPSGTDLRFSLRRMKGFADTGMLHEPGHFSNLPFGEAAAAPSEGSANGVLVIDGAFSSIGALEQPVKMMIHGGYATRIMGNGQVRQIRKLIKPFGHPGRLVAEIGIGTSNVAQLSGNTLEDEKKLGTMHVAIGNNTSFGGKNAVACHHDGVLLHPTLILDGKTILEKGMMRIS